ncbi:uncharacterized protein LOC144625677 [Crassostrea virginica]
MLPAIGKKMIAITVSGIYCQLMEQIHEINSSGMSKAKLGSKTRDDSNEVILNEDFENHLKEIQKEWEGKRSVSHIRILLSQSRRGRNHWMSTLKVGKIAPIFKKFLALRKEAIFSTKFYSMRDKEHPDQAWNHMIAKLDLLFLHSSKEKALPKDATELDK